MAEIASIFVTPIIETVVGDISSLIKEKYRLITGVHEDVSRLSSTLTSIKAVLEDAEKKQSTDASVRDWLGKLKEAALDAGDAIDMYRTEASLWKQKKQRKTLSSPFNTGISYKHKAAKNIKAILIRFDEITKEKDDFHFVVSITPTNPELPPLTSSVVDKEEVVGREDDIKKIIEMLLSNQHNGDDHPRVIPIIGMGGLGKTTLAQVVYSDERIINKFEFRMWVCVTVNFDLTRILKEMIEFLSKIQYDINLSNEQLQSRCLEIMKGKQFLLVLDDVWMDDNLQWTELQKFLKQGNIGSSVLVTSRSEKVSRAMATEKPYSLEGLPEEQCWLLFKKFAFNSTVNSSGVQTDLEVTGREIVRKCERLPLAVKAMGGLLHGNTDVSEWKRISNNDIWKVEEEQHDTAGYRPKILPALKLSYDHLSSHLKACFAYFSIFPKGYVFDKEELVKLWMAEALVKFREQARQVDTGNNYFKELLFRSFFQIFNVENKARYRMHDLMHDLAQSVSNPYCYQVKDKDSCNTAENTRHLSILSTDLKEISTQIIEKSKKLRTLLLPGDYLKELGIGTLNSMFHKFRYMRVLDLSSCSITELPETVEELKLLRYLDLSKTEIRMLPNSICSLINLMTLKLLGCLWLDVLPKNLGNLSNLQHLELDDIFWYKCSTLPPRLGRLTNLHKLNAFRVGREEGYGIDELNKMVYLTGVLHISGLENVVGDAKDAKLGEKESLRKVVLEWSSISDDVELPQDQQAAQEKVLEDLQPHLNITELQIRQYEGSSIPLWIRDGQLRDLSKLSLIHCTKCTTLSIGQLPRLVQLCIKGMLELEEWQELEWDQFHSLCTLKISYCPKLKKFPSYFANLRVMKIKRCGSLKTLALTPELAFLILVENPVLEEWHDTAYLYPFINLIELTVINCNKLKALPQIVFAPQKLEIHGCELLSTLPTQEFAQRFHHLALVSCHDGTLVRAIPSTNSLYSLVISGISNLIVLSKWPHLPGLKFLYISDCKDLLSLSQDEEEQSMRSLTALNLLSIRNCPKFEKFPSQGLPATLECLIISACPNIKLLGPNGMLTGLTSLKDLYVEDCPILQSLPDDGIPPSLKHLHIKGCPLLSDRCKKEGGLDWTKIKDVPDLEIDTVTMSTITNLPENVMGHNSIQAANPRASSPTCFPDFNILGRGKYSKGKMTQGESSSQASKKK